MVQSAHTSRCTRNGHSHLTWAGEEKVAKYWFCDLFASFFRSAGRVCGSYRSMASLAHPFVLLSRHTPAFFHSSSYRSLRAETVEEFFLCPAVFSAYNLLIDVFLLPSSPWKPPAIFHSLLQAVVPPHPVLVGTSLAVRQSAQVN